jgi:Ca2+-binding RTX toxin-like protein
MSDIQYYAGNASFAPPHTTFDITSVVAKRVGPYVNYYSFNTDGTMFVLHTQTVLDSSGNPVPTIVGWDHLDPGTGNILQSATANLALQPFLDNLHGRNPSSVRAFNYFMSGDDNLTGSNGRDVMFGLGGNDTVSGQEGNDRLVGGNGNDLLDGGNGIDNLNGQAGDDRLQGGAGADLLSGGLGSDTFDFSSIADGGDKIADFTRGADHIGLSQTGFGLAGSLVDGDTFIAGAGGGTPVSAAPTFIYDTSTGVLSFDSDGTGAGAAVRLATFTNLTTLSASDFVLI